jgi:hypothetical protein
MSYYVGVNKNSDAASPAAEGNTSTGRDVELVINTGTLTTEQVITALEKIRNHVVATSKNWGA